MSIPEKNSLSVGNFVFLLKTFNFEDFFRKCGRNFSGKKLSHTLSSRVLK
jgi:hypothetical protein